MVPVRAAMTMTMTVPRAMVIFWRMTGRAALYVMTVMALVSGVDYFRKYLPALLARDAGAAEEAAPGADAPSVTKV